MKTAKGASDSGMSKPIPCPQCGFWRKVAFAALKKTKDGQKLYVKKCAQCGYRFPGLVTLEAASSPASEGPGAANDTEPAARKTKKKAASASAPRPRSPKVAKRRKGKTGE